MLESLIFIFKKTANFHRSEFMRQFLLYGHVLSTEEAELYADYELKKNPPTLDNFKDQVCVTFAIPKPWHDGILWVADSAETGMLLCHFQFFPDISGIQTSNLLVTYLLSFF